MSREPREIAELPHPEAPLRDGIEEDDHRIPPWFNVSFGLSILFAVVYVPWYLFGGWSSTGQWAAEVERAEERYAAVRAAQPSGNPYRGDAAAVAAGAELFTTICAACHKPDGSGLVGPSLVDPYSKYGETDEALFESVSAGRALGMPPWGPQLGSEKIWKVLAYLETLPRVEEPGVGAPEGWKPEG